MIAAVLTFGIVLAFFAYCFAQIEAEHDAQAIANHEPINHRQGWMQRAGIVVSVVAAFYCFTALLWGGLLWPCVLLLVMAAAVFSCEFRRSLNELRGLDRYFVSGSNAYDRFFMRMDDLIQFGRMSNTTMYIFSDGFFRHGDKFVMDCVRRAGRLAHRVETITALACYAGALIITYIHAT